MSSMTDQDRYEPQPGEVAMWHKLSGLPDNVTGDGEVVDCAEGRRQQIQKDALRLEIRRLRQTTHSSRARSLAGLSASYLLAGDVETARRYATAAQEAAADPEATG
jgi:hypothetical protein